jgi:uncharacterized membrane protein YbhN (UPF0104 family)
VNATLKRWAGWALRVVLTIAVTYLLFRSLRISWSEIGALDTESWRPRPIPFVASLLVLLAVLVYAVRLWLAMVRSLGGPALPLGDAVRIFYLANLGRYVPGKVWQLAGLAYLAGKRGVSLPVATSSAVLGQIFSLGAAATVAAVGLVLGVGSGYPREVVPWALALLVLVAVGTLVPAALRLGLRIAFRLSGKGQGAPEIDGWFGARWLGLYLPVWLGYGIAFGLLWASFPALPPVFWPGAIGGFAAAYFLGYAALFAPAGVGVREGAMAVLLTPWAGAAAAAVLAVIARIWMTVGELVPLSVAGGAWALARLRNDPESLTR